MIAEPVARIIQSKIDPELVSLSWEQDTRCADVVAFQPSIDIASGVLWHSGLETYLYNQMNPTMSTSLTVMIEDILKHLISFQVKIPNLSEVRSYLFSHYKLMAGIEEICLRAFREFGDNSQLSLEVTSDPEIDWRELVLYVRRHEYSPSIMEEIDRFNDSCDLPILSGADSLLITTDFQPPK